MSKKKITQTSLPLSRTTKIMNSAVGVESVDPDIVALATKATELFLADFARKAYANSDSNVLEYEDIQRLVHDDPHYDFLIDTTPKKIKFKEALKLIEQSRQTQTSTHQNLQQSVPPKSQPSPEPQDLAPAERPTSQQSGASESSETPSSYHDSNLDND